MEAAVVAKTDVTWGKLPVPSFRVKPRQQLSEEAVLNFCRENLARFKVPKNVVFTDLPKTSTGKVQKLASETAEKI